LGGLAIIIGLWVAYKQYKASVEIAKIAAKREAIKLAAEQAAVFGQSLLKKLPALRKRIEDAGCDYLQKCKVTADEEQIKTDASGVNEETRIKLREHGQEIATTLNELEAFAIFFATDVADDNVGFIECGPAFVNLFEEYFALYSTFKLDKYYRATQSLYWRWKKRMAQQQLMTECENLGNQAIVILKKFIPKDLNPRNPLGS
jgi:hypothetical protein